MFAGMSEFRPKICNFAVNDNSLGDGIFEISAKPGCESELMNRDYFISALWENARAR